MLILNVPAKIDEFITTSKQLTITLIGKNISFIEAHLDEEVMLTAESLHDSLAISSSKQKGNNLWEFTVIDGPYHYQTEICLKGEIIMETQCNCVAFSKYKVCGHIGASLLTLRKSQVGVTEDKPTRRSPKRASRAIKTFLDQIPHEDLFDFVRDYARTDTWFRKKLEARFYDLKLDHEKEQFIESLFPARTTADKKIPAKIFSGFIKLTGELLSQFNEYISLQDYRQAYRLIYLLVKKSFYIKFYLPNRHTGFYTSHGNLLLNYHEIIKLIEAPEFRSLVMREMLELVSSSYVLITEPDERRLWMMLYDKPDFREELLVLVRKMPSQPVKNYAHEHFMAMIELFLVSKSDALPLLRIKDNQQIYRLTLNLIEYKRYERSQWLLKSIVKEREISETQLRQILRHLVEFEGDIDLADSLIHRATKMNSRFIWNWLIKHPGLWQYVLKSIDEDSFPRDNPAVEINFHCATGNYKQAAHLLDVNLSFHLLKQFDQEFLSHAPELITTLYINMTTQYLENHYGHQARSMLADIYTRLRSISADNLLRQLKQSVNKKFPERSFHY